MVERLSLTDPEKQRAAKHGYIMETTSPDKSSQNELAEWPHQMLKVWVWCLLLTAGLGVESRSSALIHATWLFNLTFHSTIDIMPHPSSVCVPTTKARSPTNFQLHSHSKEDKRSNVITGPQLPPRYFPRYLPNNDSRYWDIATHNQRRQQEVTENNLTSYNMETIRHSRALQPSISWMWG